MGDLKKWRDQDWVRVGTDGKIKGACGTSKDKKNPDRCLPRSKAASLSQSQRASTAKKKKREGLKYEVVKLTKQMDKMQTVYGRLKSTKYSGNEEAFEKAREACEKEVENDLVSKKNLKKDRRQEVTPLAENNNN